MEIEKQSFWKSLISVYTLYSLGTSLFLALRPRLAGSWREAKVCSEGVQTRQLLEFRKAKESFPTQRAECQAAVLSYTLDEMHLSFSI